MRLVSPLVRTSYLRQPRRYDNLHQVLGSVSTLGVSTLGVSTLGVSTLGVSTLGVSTLGVSTLGVSTLGVLDDLGFLKNLL